MLPPTSSPRRGTDGVYRCKLCGTIFIAVGQYCPACTAQRAAHTRGVLKRLSRYVWPVLIVVLCLLAAWFLLQ